MNVCELVIVTTVVKCLEGSVDWKSTIAMQIHLSMLTWLTHKLWGSQSSMTDVIFNNTAQCHTPHSAIRAPTLPMKTPSYEAQVWLHGFLFVCFSFFFGSSNHIWLRDCCFKEYPDCELMVMTCQSQCSYCLLSLNQTWIYKMSLMLCWIILCWRKLWGVDGDHEVIWKVNIVVIKQVIRRVIFK